MDNQILYDKFRGQLTNVHALTVLTVSLFEIIGYVILVLSGVEFFSLGNHYLWYGVVGPIVINVITHLIARLIVNNPSVSRQKKNTSIIVAALVTSFVVALIHKEYIVTSCAFIFPIILSSIFNDRKLLIVSFSSSIVILSCVGVAFWLDRSITLTTSINLFILFGFSFISFLCGIISINFSRQSSATIELQAAQNDKLRDDVKRDSMTGLYNHKHFETQLGEMITAFDPEAPFTLAMVDVDYFKSVNDTYGHDEGDDVLIRLARMLKKHCSESDTAYRYGGEEFAVIFRGKREDEAAVIMEGILEEFRSYVFDFTSDPITFSAGVSEYVSGTSYEDFFDWADDTLIAAKAAGRNRILIAKH